MSAHISTTAQVSGDARLGINVFVWEYSIVSAGAIIGDNTNLGSYVYIHNNVKIGNNCKIQNNAQIYEPALIHDGVFIGPGVIFTNDKAPRAITKDGAKTSAKQWRKLGVVVNTGASIGAGSVCVAPVTIGSWAMVGAGSVIIKDVPNFAVVVGNPGLQIGWVGESGARLEEKSSNKFVCPVTGDQFFLKEGLLNKVLEK